MGLERATAARFSFLLGIPAITLAGIVEFKDFLEVGARRGSDSSDCRANLSWNFFLCGNCLTLAVLTNPKYLGVCLVPSGFWGGNSRGDCP